MTGEATLKDVTVPDIGDFDDVPVIEVLVSTTGMAAGDFTSVLTIRRQSGEERLLGIGAMVTAKYVKLVLHQPS